jgi:mannose-6-phosphate isomerase
MRRSVETIGRVLLHARLRRVIRRTKKSASSSVSAPRAILLACDNFTSPARTPWGGRRIARVLKAGLVDPDLVVGESWELSLASELPSRLDGSRTTLAEALGPEARGTALLVKLLDAREPLSVQIHPEDGDPALAPGECGKPESWYVEHAEPGAAIWLGLAEHATPQSVRAAIERGEDLSRELAKIEVAAGDFFAVEARTPHAIGAGVTLVEPQRVAPGTRGVTYRYWDWNRRYDPKGDVSADGAPRELHVERALAVTDWDRPRGERFLGAMRYRAGPPGTAGEIGAEHLCGRRGPVASESLDVQRLAGSGRLALPPAPYLRSLTVLEGTVRAGGIEVRAGRTAALPASEGPLEVAGHRACAILASAR